MLNVLILLIACADPKPVAIAACQAVPGIATDEAGITLLEPLLVPKEIELLKAAKPTLGLEKVGAEGLARLRSETTCVIDEVNGAGSDRWQVLMTRTQPEVKVDGSFGDKVERKIDWQAVDTSDGVRIETSLPTAASMRAKVDEAMVGSDYKRVAGLWRGIAEHHTDPLLVIDVDRASTLYDEQYTLSKLQAAFDRVEDPADPKGPQIVVGVVRNKSKRALASAVVTFTFTPEVAEVVAGAEPLPPPAPVVVEVDAGHIDAEGKVEVRTNVPDGVVGSVKVETKSITLEQAP